MYYIVCTIERGKIVGMYQGNNPVGRGWFEKGFFEHRNKNVLEELGYRRVR